MQTGRRFEASACQFMQLTTYNWRIKLSLISLIQLKFGLAHLQPPGHGRTKPRSQSFPYDALEEFKLPRKAVQSLVSQTVRI
jgi:hypothetical protein